jgi:hypothetical protein
MCDGTRIAEREDRSEAIAALIQLMTIWGFYRRRRLYKARGRNGDKWLFSRFRDPLRFGVRPDQREDQPRSI